MKALRYLPYFKNYWSNMFQFFQQHFPMATLKIEKAWPNTNVPFYFQWVTLFCFVGGFNQRHKKWAYFHLPWRERRKGLTNPQRDSPGVPGKIHGEEKGVCLCFLFELCTSIEMCACKKMPVLKLNRIAPRMMRPHKYERVKEVFCWFVCSFVCFYCEKSFSRFQRTYRENTFSCF